MKENNGFIHKIASFIVDRKSLFFLLYGFAIIFSCFSFQWVDVENDVTTYLPENTETRQGLTVMNDHFVTNASAKIMVSNITYDTAEDIYDMLKNVDGVEIVTFDHTKEHFRDASAEYDLNFKGEVDNPVSVKAMETIKKNLKDYDASYDTLIGYDEIAELDQEIQVILLVAVVIIVVVLVLTSRAYAEVPVLLLTFGTAAILNKGTDFLCGKISFISNSIAVVLQLALAIDYAIILCHRFSDEHETKNPREACIDALSKAIPEISASSLTTISGLFALSFMQFGIGKDMSIVLIKSVLLSLLSVFTLMPGLLMLFSPWIDKTKHKKLLPNITLLGKLAVKTRYIMPVFFLITIIGAFFLSNNCPYCYSFTDLETKKMSQRQVDHLKIKDTFGTNNMVALIVPSGNYRAEKAITKKLKEYPEVIDVTALSATQIFDYYLTDSLTARQFSEMIGLDYEVAKGVYSAYALEQDQYGELLSGLKNYKVPLFDMFVFLKDKIQSKNILLDGQTKDKMNQLFEQLDSAQAQLHNDKYSRMAVYS